MKLKLIILSFLLLIATCFTVSPASAGNQAQITVTAIGYTTFPCVPTNIVITIVGKNCFNMSWDKGLNSPNTLITLCKETAHDCNLSDIGNLSDSCWIVYNGSGTSFELPSCGLEFDLYQYYVTVWGYNNASAYSNCTSLEVKGDSSMMMLFILGFLALGSTFFAFRLRDILITMGSAIGWLSILLFAFSTNHDFIMTNPWVWAFVLGVMCFIIGILLVYMRKEIDQYGRMVQKQKDDRNPTQVRRETYKQHLHQISGRPKRRY